MYEDIKKALYREVNLAELSNGKLRETIGIYWDRLYGSRDRNERERAIERIFSSLRGFGVLDVLLQDESVTEIMVNSYREIFIEQNGKLLQSKVRFESEGELLNTIQKIVSQSGREVNQAHPIADARLPGGERVNVVLPPVSLTGPVVTVRKFPKQRITLHRLVEFESVSLEAARFLDRLVKAKYNIFISGGTASGKTTFLNALSDCIPPNERIITIEDSAELQIQGIPNLIRMETRNPNTTGAGQVSMRDLIRTSLRMRPDRIIVGEVRGAEALDMLGAMNTGHDGSLSTGHANSSYDMLRRLESMVMEANSGLPLAAVRQNISSSIDIIVHLGKIGNRRRVLEISEVSGLKDGEIQLNPLFLEQEARLFPTGNALQHTRKLEVYTAVSGEDGALFPDKGKKKGSKQSVLQKTESVYCF